MARPLRIEFPGALYHVSSSGRAGRPIFLADDDRRLFLDLLGREIAQHRWRCYAYCLLQTEYRLLIETPEPNLGRGIGRLNAVYSQAFDRRRPRTGPLFHSRYRAILIERDPFLPALARDLALAPVRAGLVKRPKQWRWSSHRPIGKNRDVPSWLDPSAVLDCFRDSLKGQRKAYRAFVAAGQNDPSPWQHLRGQMFLGSDAFRSAIVHGHWCSLDESTLPVQRAERPAPEDIIQRVAELASLPAEAVLDRRVNPNVFQVTVYLLRRVGNLPLAEVAERAGVSPPRISQIQRQIEDAGGLAAAHHWARSLDRLLA